MDVAAIADELYGADPAEFTSLRDAYVTEARREGDREGAQAIKALKRPSPAAWAVNLLVRERREDLSRALELGRELRDAQARLSGEDMRRLSRRRQQVVVELAREASGLAADRGRRLGGNVARQVEATLNAALVDLDAAATVASGRLVRPLEHTGMGPVDVSDAAAVPTGAPAPGPLPAPRPAGSHAEKDAARDRRRRASGQARTALADAEEELERAQAAALEADSALHTAELRLAGAGENVHRLEEELASARREADAAHAAAGDAARFRDRARATLEDARRRAKEAREALVALEKP